MMRTGLSIARCRVLTTLPPFAKFWRLCAGRGPARQLPLAHRLEHHAARDKAQQQGDELVAEARHHQPAPGHQAAVAGFRDLPRADGEDPRAVAFGPGAHGKLGRHRPRRQQRDADAARLQFAGQRLGEGQHIGLGGVIDRAAGTGQEAGDRADIEQPALVAGERLDEGERQFGERADVEVDHAQRLLAVARGGEPDQAEGGVVDDVLRLEVVRAQRLGDRLRGAGRGEVGDDHRRHARTRGGDLRRQRLETVGAAGDQNEVVAVIREHARELGADAGRGAGDDGDGAKLAHAVTIYPFAAAKAASRNKIGGRIFFSLHSRWRKNERTRANAARGNKQVINNREPCRLPIASGTKWWARVGGAYSRFLLTGKSRENTGCCTALAGSAVQNWLTCGSVLTTVLVSLPSTRATLRIWMSS